MMIQSMGYDDTEDEESSMYHSVGQSYQHTGVGPVTTSEITCFPHCVHAAPDFSSARACSLPDTFSIRHPPAAEVSKAVRSGKPSPPLH